MAEYAITGDIATLLGVDHTTGDPAALWVEASQPILVDGTTGRLGGRIRADLADDGTFAVSGLPESVGGAVPLYRMRFDSLSLRRAGKPKGETTNWFPLTTDRDLAWIVENYVDVIAITPEIAANVAAAASLGATNDTATASFVDDDGSATHTALTTFTAGFARAEGRPINARDNGVTEAIADISVPLNALITANPGATIVLPPADYTTNADNGTPTSGHGGGIILNQTGTTLDLRGATITMQASTSTHYQILDITAADCHIIGGHIIGDVDSHTGDPSEWGHGLVTGANADRLRVDGLRASKCWGDGFYISDGPEDVELRSVIADQNRRLGAGIINATRLRVIGGAFINNGTVAETGPAGGMDIEPDPSSTHEVRDILISGALFAGNTGSGLLISSNDRPLDGAIVGCVSSNNGTGATGYKHGFDLRGSTNRIRLSNCHAEGNTGHGFTGDSTINFATLSGCVAVDNTATGFSMSGQHPLLVGCVARQNNQANAGSPNFDIYSENARLIACLSHPGQTVVPSYGYVIRTGATARLLGCDVGAGAFGTAAYLVQGGATAEAFPPPGTERAVANANTSGATLAALETEVNELKNLLRTFGMLSS